MWIQFGVVGALLILQTVTSQDQLVDDALPEQLDTTKALVDNISPSAQSQSTQAPPKESSPPDNWPQSSPAPVHSIPPAHSPRRAFRSSPHDNGVPPGFESVLPADIIQQLKALHNNRTLSFPQKREEFDRILNSVPGEILAKLPFPPGFEALPTGIKKKISEIHTNPQLSWNEKSKQIGQIIESLPPNQRQHLSGAPLARGLKLNFPPTPPPGFEKVLPKEMYQKLLIIHQDPSLTPKEKIHKIDGIMRSLDQKILDALPLPPGFDQLPTETVKKAKAIFSDKTLDYESKNKKIIQFVKSLPAEQRQLVKPPMPPVLNQLPKQVKNQIDAIFDNEDLDEEQRHNEFWKLVDTLPAEQRTSIHAELGDTKGTQSGAPFGDDEVASSEAPDAHLFSSS